MIKTLLRVFAVILAVAVLVLPAEAARRNRKNKVPAKPPAVAVFIDISSQSMSVKVNGSPLGNWRVSTARQGYYTPRGSYRVRHTARMHYSRKYDNAPMPYSIFFLGGYAIHGTSSIKSLGRPASHGCVRLHPSNALALYNLVNKYGASRTRITLTN